MIFGGICIFCVFVNLQICVLSDSVFLLGRLTKQPRASSTGECEGEIQVEGETAVV